MAPRRDTVQVARAPAVQTHWALVFPHKNKQREWHRCIEKENTGIGLVVE